jgi:hypothetical protein
MSGLDLRQNRVSFSEYMEEKKRLRAAGAVPAPDETLISSEEAAAILRRAQAITPPCVENGERDSDDEEGLPDCDAATNEPSSSQAQAESLSTEEANAILARARAIVPAEEKSWKSKLSFGFLG